MPRRFIGGLQVFGMLKTAKPPNRLYENGGGGQAVLETQPNPARALSAPSRRGSGSGCAGSRAPARAAVFAPVVADACPARPEGVRGVLPAIALTPAPAGSSAASSLALSACSAGSAARHRLGSKCAPAWMCSVGRSRSRSRSRSSSRARARARARVCACAAVGECAAMT